MSWQVLKNHSAKKYAKHCFHHERTLISLFQIKFLQCYLVCNFKVVITKEDGMKKAKYFLSIIKKRKIVGKTWDQELAINLSIIGIPIAVTSMLDKKDSVSTSLALYLT